MANITNIIRDFIEKIKCFRKETQEFNNSEDKKILTNLNLIEPLNKELGDLSEEIKSLTEKITECLKRKSLNNNGVNSYFCNPKKSTSNETTSNQTTSNQTISNETTSNETTANETISNETISNQTIEESATTETTCEYKTLEVESIGLKLIDLKFLDKYKEKIELNNNQINQTELINNKEANQTELINNKESNQTELNDYAEKEISQIELNNKEKNQTESINNNEISQTESNNNNNELNNDNLNEVTNKSTIKQPINAGQLLNDKIDKRINLDDDSNSNNCEIFFSKFNHKNDSFKEIIGDILSDISDTPIDELDSNLKEQKNNSNTANKTSTTNISPLNNVVNSSFIPTNRPLDELSKVNENNKSPNTIFSTNRPRNEPIDNDDDRFDLTTPRRKQKQNNNQTIENIQPSTSQYLDSFDDLDDLDDFDKFSVKTISDDESIKLEPNKSNRNRAKSSQLSKRKKCKEFKVCLVSLPEYLISLALDDVKKAEKEIKNYEKRILNNAEKNPKYICFSFTNKLNENIAKINKPTKSKIPANPLLDDILSIYESKNESSNEPPPKKRCTEKNKIKSNDKNSDDDDDDNINKPPNRNNINKRQIQSSSEEESDSEVTSFGDINDMNVHIDDSNKPNQHKRLKADDVYSSDTETADDDQGCDSVDSSSLNANDCNFGLNNIGQTKKKRTRRDSDNGNHSNKNWVKQTLKLNREENIRQEKLDKITERYNTINGLDIENNKSLILEYDDKGEHVIKIDPVFAEDMKEHQIEAFKFLYLNTVESKKFLIETNGSHELGSIIAHSMGLGKTLLILSFVHCLYQNLNQYFKKFLILTPKNVNENWAQEYDLWIKQKNLSIPIFKFYLCNNHQDKLNMLLGWQELGGIMLCSHNNFYELINFEKPDEPKDFWINVKKILLTPGPDLVVVDEAHELKNKKSLLNLAINRIRTKRRICLTGTPLQNNLEEYYHIVDFVRPHLLGQFKEFKEWFIKPIVGGQNSSSTVYQVEGMDRSIMALQKVLKNVLHRKNYLVLQKDLPQKHEFLIKLKMTELQEKLYFEFLDVTSDEPKIPLEKLQEELISLNDSSDKSDKSDKQKNKRGQFLKWWHILSNIYNHPKLILKNKTADEKNNCQYGEWYKDILKNNFEDEEYSKIKCSNKMQIFMEILRKTELAGDKLVVFSQSLQFLKLIEEALDLEQRKRKSDSNLCRMFADKFRTFVKDEDYFRLDGSQSAFSRQQNINKFNLEGNKRSRLFLISTRAGCLGINLTAANRCIIMDMNWNPSIDLQAIFRIFRYGQKKETFIYRLYSEAMENDLYQQQILKQSLANRVIDDHQSKRNFKRKENFKEYREFKPTKPEDFKEITLPNDELLASVIKEMNEKIIIDVQDHNILLEKDHEFAPEERINAYLEYEKTLVNLEKEKERRDQKTKIEYFQNNLGLKPNDIINKNNNQLSDNDKNEPVQEEASENSSQNLNLQNNKEFAKTEEQNKENQPIKSGQNQTVTNAQNQPENSPKTPSINDKDSKKTEDREKENQPVTNVQNQPEDSSKTPILSQHVKDNLNIESTINDKDSKKTEDREKKNQPVTNVQNRAENCSNLFNLLSQQKNLCQSQKFQNVHNQYHTTFQPHCNLNSNQQNIQQYPKVHLPNNNTQGCINQNLNYPQQNLNYPQQNLNIQPNFHQTPINQMPYTSQSTFINSNNQTNFSHANLINRQNNVQHTTSFTNLPQHHSPSNHQRPNIVFLNYQSNINRNISTKILQQQNTSIPTNVHQLNQQQNRSTTTNVNHQQNGPTPTNAHQQQTNFNQFISSQPNKPTNVPNQQQTNFNQFNSTQQNTSIPTNVHQLNQQQNRSTTTNVNHQQNGPTPTNAHQQQTNFNQFISSQPNKPTNVHQLNQQQNRSTTTNVPNQQQTNFNQFNPTQQNTSIPTNVHQLNQQQNRSTTTNVPNQQRTNPTIFNQQSGRIPLNNPNLSNLQQLNKNFVPARVITPVNEIHNKALDKLKKDILNIIKSIQLTIPYDVYMLLDAIEKSVLRNKSSLEKQKNQSNQVEISILQTEYGIIQHLLSNKASILEKFNRDLRFSKLTNLLKESVYNQHNLQIDELD